MPGGGAGFDHTAEAGGQAGDDRHRLADAANRSAIDPGFVQLDGRIVDQVAHLEVVGAIKHEINILHEIDDVGVIDIGHDRFDGNFRVDTTELVGGSLGLGQIASDIIFIEEYLSLEVMVFDEVPIDDADKAHTGPNERVCQNGAERPATTQRDSAGEEFLLPRLAHAMKPHLSAVTFHSVLSELRIALLWQGRTVLRLPLREVQSCCSSDDRATEYR